MAVIATLGVYDAWRATKHDGSTLSEVTRSVFSTDQTPGKTVFLVSYGTGAVVLAVHIIKNQ